MKVNREVSWLSFNERVLQESMDPKNPLIERIRFLGIFSSNRDEFFRVRIASIKRMSYLGKKAREQLYEDPNELLQDLRSIVVQQENKFHLSFEKIIQELEDNKIHFLNEQKLSPKQEDIILDYFKNTVRPTLVPLMLTNKAALDLTDSASFLAIKMYNKGNETSPKYALIEIPSQILSRFFILPEENGDKYVLMLDDVIRYGLPQIFKLFDYSIIEAYAVKLTRDAELDIEEDLDESLIEKLQKSVHKRRIGPPVRFVHDKNIPDDLLDFLINKLELVDQENIISSGKYHNLKDLMKFPHLGCNDLVYPEVDQCKHPDLVNKKSLLSVISDKDIMLHYPYQTFTHTIDILREAAIAPDVTQICITLYRVTKKSKILNALINASKNGKTVRVIIELRARFDEQRNIEWAKKLQENGVEVIFGVQGLKVHTKVILIERKSKKEVDYIAHVGTGNFHENTAKLYTDFSLWTANPKITKELKNLFDFFQSNYKHYNYSSLIVSPFNTRSKINRLINNEIKNKKNGKEAWIMIKLNNLVDGKIIDKLYEASTAGVKIKMIIRGICSLVPGIPGLSENIEVISILGRYLHHSRVLVFANDGETECYIGSCDWMPRNLDKRIEVMAPIYDPSIKSDIIESLNLQFEDNVKARIIDRDQQNIYKKSKGKIIDSNEETYNLYRK